VTVLSEGDGIELRVTPDRYVTVRYAGASGDFNPIHIDDQFARDVGLPGRILHGLWSMAQVARAVTDATEDPTALRALSVQFRGMGRPDAEIVITGDIEAVTDGIGTARLNAVQGDTRLIRGAVAELRVE
jgi:acyl dehydratase